VRANAWRAFRAPTLNELYRPFQVGAVFTQANPGLRAESVLGGELGTELSPLAGWHTRVTGFWNELQDPIVNATLTPTTRQRQNLGRARVRGLELETEYRPTSFLTAIAGYTFVDPVVTSRPDAPDLEGLDLPQDPRHRLSAQLAFAHPRYVDATLFARWTSAQYEDDRSTLPMEGYVLVDLFVAREVSHGLSIFGAVENAFDAQYVVGRAGVDTIGAPRTFKAGVRLRSQ
jgi:iron complex outermembrane recepter protein